MEGNNNKLSNSWLALGVVVIGTFMAILDSSIVNIALPKLMSVFGMTQDNAKWILTAYSLAQGAIIPLTGYLQETFGAKKIYIYAMTIFTLGSLLCGFSWNGTSMIGFRIIQALGGGMILPVGMTIIYGLFPKEKIGMALGFWGIASMAAPAIGPTLGGLIIEKMEWRMIFYVNVPIGIMGVILGGILLKDSKMKPFKSFDIIGFLSSTIGIVSVLYVLGEGSTIDWSEIQNPILMTLGCLSLLLFVVNELTHPTPLLDLRLFKVFNFSVSTIITCILTLALMGTTYILPLFLQNIKGYSAMESGMIMLPAALVTAVLMPVSGNLFDRFGMKPIAIPGLIALGIASYELSNSININSSKGSIILITCIRAVGLGIAMMPISTSGMNAVKSELVGGASALSNTVKQIAGAVSVTVMSTLMQGRTNYNYAKLAEQITIYNKSSNDMISTLTQSYMHSGMSQSVSKVSAVSKLTQMLQVRASIEGMQYAVIVTAVAVVAALILILFMNSKKKAVKSKDEVQAVEA